MTKQTRKQTRYTPHIHISYTPRTLYKTLNISTSYIVTRKTDKNPIKINQFSNKRLGLLVLREWAKHNSRIIGFSRFVLLLKSYFIFYNNQKRRSLQGNNCYYYKEVDKIISH